MADNRLLAALGLVLLLLLVAALAVLTQQEQDPCANPGADVSAAILADDSGDQDALANRAIIMRGKCPRPAGPEPD